MVDWVGAENTCIPYALALALRGKSLREIARESSHWYRWPNSSLANGVFWRSTSTWSNGALVFMAQSRRAVTTKEPRPGISTGNRRHGSPRSCQLP